MQIQQIIPGLEDAMIDHMVLMILLVQDKSDNHLTGELWCSTMFELYRKLGGDSAYIGVKGSARDLIIRFH